MHAACIVREEHTVQIRLLGEPGQYWAKLAREVRMDKQELHTGLCDRSLQVGFRAPARFAVVHPSYTMTLTLAMRLFRLRLTGLTHTDQHVLNLLMQAGQHIHAHRHAGDERAL